jgi:hypothetical protein
MAENYQNLKRSIDMMHSQNVQKFRSIRQKRIDQGTALEGRIAALEENLAKLIAYVDTIHTDGDVD